MHLLMFDGSSERASPLTIEEYENNYRELSSDLNLIERIYKGGISCNQLRTALWPYIFGLTKNRGRFIARDKNSSSLPSFNHIGSVSDTNHTANHAHIHNNNNGKTINNNHHQQHSPDSYALRQDYKSSTNHFNGQPSSYDQRRSHQISAPSLRRHKTEYVYVEHEANSKRWRELERQYYNYQSQWKSIMPEQELRFSIFRERKALIERDVVRSDRLHPFYADNSNNMSTLTALLMTYMMYDFDIGYSQGMSDIAAPILYVFGGDLVKAFWVFVEVMKLFRMNFEANQKSIHFQLNLLYRLIKLTDPKFAIYLKQNDCSNCFFAFRSIVCQFKRELMKSRFENDYTKVLSLWDTIWSVQKRHDLLSKSKYVHTFTIANGKCLYKTNKFLANGRETEKFVLSLCLSMILRERNLIIAKQMDASEIHQHFINPSVANELDHFIEVAFQIYRYLNTDCDLQALVKGASQSASSVVDTANNPADPVLCDSDVKVDEVADTYELLKDYFIISPTSYNTASTHPHRSWDDFLHHNNRLDEI